MLYEPFDFYRIGFDVRIQHTLTRRGVVRIPSKKKKRKKNVTDDGRISGTGRGRVVRPATFMRPTRRYTGEP